MDLMQKLSEATEWASDKKDLPNYLYDHIQNIIRNPDKFADKRKEIEFMIEQLEQFDIFAQTGYIGRGYTPFSIEESLKQILGLSKIVER